MSSENSLLPRVWELERSLASAVRVNESLRQQLADSQKREVMLRDVLADARVFLHTSQFSAYSAKMADEALAATADLDGLILCNAEPVCMADPLDIAKDGNNDTFIVKHASEWHELLRFKTPLYRAWEPK